MFKDKHGRKLAWQEAKPKIVNRLSNYWLDVKLLLLAWVGLAPLHSFRLGFYRLAGMKIGHGSRIHMGCRFFDPKGIVIGEDTIIGDNAFLDGRASLTIGSHVSIASQVLIYNSEHDIDDDNFVAKVESVMIEDYVFIGPRVIILPGVKIGYGAVIAAGAVVTKDVLPRNVMGGIPAGFLRQRKGETYNYRLGRARLFQ